MTIEQDYVAQLERIAELEAEKEWLVRKAELAAEFVERFAALDQKGPRT